MTDEKKQEYTLRITNANISELTVILCDMFIDYCTDAVNHVNEADVKGFHVDIARARKVLSELINSLDRTLKLSDYIYELYRYVERLVISADVKCKSEPLIQGMDIIRRLNESYREVSSKDDSLPLMSNTETVYAGMTYGKYDISSQAVTASNRGYFA